ncbi:MAG TPA: hypothetical protein VLT33_20210 [Labilithrix sp.]|nr:hypothetical protein [Labilithrix sp.]
MRIVVLAALVGGAAALGGCSGCSRDQPAPPGPLASASAPIGSAPPGVVAESLPRCRTDGARLALAGDDVVVGEAVLGPDALFLGVVRREGTKRLAGIVRAALDLSSSRMVELGPALGDDPPPTPRLRGTTAYVTSFTRRSAAGADAGADAGAGAMGATRRLEIARLDAGGLVAEGTITQQADESLAYDVAWPEGGAPGAALVAWDEDAPPEVARALGDRGVVKVQLLGAGTKARVASPDKSDAEAPRLLARPGGYWLAWLARRAEAVEDAGPNGNAEGPGERRAYRWVELVTLDAKGEATSPVRRISPEKGRVASFDLVRTDAQVVVLVQDEAAHAEGAGERMVRYVTDGDKVESADLLDGGIGHALADLLPQGAGPNRWLAFVDPQEHAHVVPLGPTLRVAGPSTTEPALDGARVLGSAPPDVVYAVGPSGAAETANGRVELRRLVCR